MFETLIREAASRFHLGDNAGRLVRLIVDAIFDDRTGGFAGTRSRFADAGLDDLFASWIGTTPGDNVLQPDQFSAGFGQDAGLTHRQHAGHSHRGGEHGGRVAAAQDRGPAHARRHRAHRPPRRL